MKNYKKAKLKRRLGVLSVQLIGTVIGCTMGVMAGMIISVFAREAVELYEWHSRSIGFHGADDVWVNVLFRKEPKYSFLDNTFMHGDVPVGTLSSDGAVTIRPPFHSTRPLQIAALTLTKVGIQLEECRRGQEKLIEDCDKPTILMPKIQCTFAER